MKSRRIAIAWGTIVSVALALPAGASTVAGWDFSQYYTDGIPSIDGSSTTSTLSANYSSFDPTFNAGDESAAFGTLTTTGSVVPTAGSLDSNLSGAADAIGENGFDAHTALAFEGQMFQEFMALTTKGSGTLIFATDLSSIGQSGTDWSVSFGGKTFDDSSCTPSCTSTVTVEYSPDGSSYSSFGSAVLDTTDQKFEFTLGAAPSVEGFVRLGLTSTSGQPIIDNVAIKVIPAPEPSTALGLLAGSMSLAIARRWRK